MHACPCTARSAGGHARRSRPATARRRPEPRGPGSKELRVCGYRRADVLAAELGHNASARCALQEAELQEVRLVDVLDRVLLLAEGDRERRQADRAAAELVQDRAQQLPVDALEADRIHLEQRERLARHVIRDHAVVPDLRDVAHAPQDAVRDPRRAARAACDLVGRVVFDLDVEDARGAPHDRPQLARLVVLEPEGHPEPVAQWRRQQSGARRRADERELRQIERERACGRALADDDVEAEVLERRIQDLLDRPVQPMDLVHEEHVVPLQPRQDRGHVALALERRPGDAADAHTKLLAHDVRQARLAEPGRTDQQHVVERVVARLRGGERDRELVLDPRLSDEIGQTPRAQRFLEDLLLRNDRRGQELGGHYAAFNACRTRSSGESSGSTAANACSASPTEYPSSTSASRATRCGCVPPADEIGTGVSPSFSFSSSTIRSAVFLPMPGIAWKRAVSSSTIARRSSAAGEPETIASATFGPTPFTDRSCTNSSRSAASANP